MLITQKEAKEVISIRKYRKYHKGEHINNFTLIERQDGGRKWLCRCDCGQYFSIQISSGQKMCAKCSRENVGNKMTKHGESNKNKTRLYNIWLGIRSRCNNPRDNEYKYYGGRGINVCKEWDDYTLFKEWAMQNGYENNLSIDRINVNNDYEPCNCRWVTPLTQGNNRRNNILLTYNGTTHTIAEWSRITGIKYGTLKRRVMTYGWSAEEALTILPHIGNNQQTRMER